MKSSVTSPSVIDTGPVQAFPLAYRGGNEIRVVATGDKGTIIVSVEVDEEGFPVVDLHFGEQKGHFFPVRVNGDPGRRRTLKPGVQLCVSLDSNVPDEDDLPFGGSHAPDCPYVTSPAGECLCWRSDPDQNPELRDDPPHPLTTTITLHEGLSAANRDRLRCAVLGAFPHAVVDDADEIDDKVWHLTPGGETTTAQYISEIILLRHILDDMPDLAGLVEFHSPVL